MVAIRLRHDGGIHVGRQSQMGPRMADLAAVLHVLGADRSTHDAQERGEGRGDQAEIRLDAVDAVGRFRNQADVELAVIGPDVGAPRQTQKMRQTAPGRYLAQIETAKPGAYHLELSQQVGSQVAFR